MHDECLGFSRTERAHGGTLVFSVSLLLYGYYYCPVYLHRDDARRAVHDWQ